MLQALQDLCLNGGCRTYAERMYVIIEYVTAHHFRSRCLLYDPPFMLLSSFLKVSRLLKARLQWQLTHCHPLTLFFHPVPLDRIVHIVSERLSDFIKSTDAITMSAGRSNDVQLTDDVGTDDTVKLSVTRNSDEETITRIMQLDLVQALMPEVIANFEEGVEPMYLADLKTSTGASDTKDLMTKILSSAVSSSDLGDMSGDEAELSELARAVHYLSRLSKRIISSKDNISDQGALWHLSQLFAALEGRMQEGLTQKQLTERYLALQGTPA